MACQKICKQNRDDNKGKYTRPHPCVFLTLGCNSSVKDVGIGLCMYMYRDKAFKIYLHLHHPYLISF